MSRAWMPLYVGDYLSDTTHLSAAEHGAYLLLIMHYWQKGCLPKNPAQLARICRMDEASFAIAMPVLSEFFNSEWHHPRIEEELRIADEKHQKRAEAGKKGGIAKAMLSKSQSNEVANACQSQSPPPLVSSEAIASASYPIDPQERLWAEGVDLLRDMGVPQNRAKPMVGKWLRDTRQDAVGVLAAIIRAREIGTRDPLPFIAGILKNLKGEPHGRRDKAAVGGADRVIERVKGFIDDATPAVRPLLTLASG